jgi:sensor domain CHASE-containing protein
MLNNISNEEDESDPSATPKRGEYANISSLNDKRDLEYVDLSNLPMNRSASRENDSSAPFNDNEYQNLEIINQGINDDDSSAPFKNNEYQNLESFNQKTNAADSLAELKENWGIEAEDIDAEFDKLLQ